VPERSAADWFDPPASRRRTEGFSGVLARRDATTQPDAPAGRISDASVEIERKSEVRLTTHYDEVENVFHRDQ
jgi:hypothetical protein